MAVDVIRYLFLSSEIGSTGLGDWVGPAVAGVVQQLKNPPFWRIPFETSYQACFFSSNLLHFKPLP